jgi:hypothetical protein
LAPFALLFFRFFICFVPDSCRAGMESDTGGSGGAQGESADGGGDGVPLVNIVTPTAGGVSVNAYRQFDI